MAKKPKYKDTFKDMTDEELANLSAYKSKDGKGSGNPFGVYSSALYNPLARFDKGYADREIELRNKEAEQRGKELNRIRTEDLTLVNSLDQAAKRNKTRKLAQTAGGRQGAANVSQGAQTNANILIGKTLLGQ